MDDAIWGIVAVVVVIAVAVGWKKLPNMIRTLGRTQAQFKMGQMEGEKDLADLKASLTPGKSSNKP